MTDTIIDRCIRFINAELDDFIPLNQVKPEITHITSKTVYDCKREVYDRFSLDCFPEPDASDKNIIIRPSGGMIYLNKTPSSNGNACALLLAFDIIDPELNAAEYMNDVARSIGNANMLSLADKITPYVIFTYGDEPLLSGLSPHCVMDTQNTSCADVEEQMENIIDNINITDRPVICVKIGTDWCENEITRICLQIIRQSMEYHGYKTTTASDETDDSWF